jgi:formylglycine-generating enzyme required for sulfatase activity
VRVAAFVAVVGLTFTCGCAATAGSRPLTEDQEHRLKRMDTFQECTGCPEMVVIPPGAFTMGSAGRRKGSIRR